MRDTLLAKQRLLLPGRCGCPKPCRGWSCDSSVFVDEVLRAPAPHRQPCQQREEPVEDATHEVPGRSAKPLVSAHDRIMGIHRDARRLMKPSATPTLGFCPAGTENSRSVCRASWRATGSGYTNAEFDCTARSGRPGSCWATVLPSSQRQVVWVVGQPRCSSGSVRSPTEAPSMVASGAPGCPSPPDCWLSQGLVSSVARMCVRWHSNM